jgi:hypothetical protein
VAEVVHKETTKAFLYKQQQVVQVEELLVLTLHQQMA